MRAGERVPKASRSAIRNRRHAKKCGLQGKRKYKTKRKARIEAQLAARELDRDFFIYLCPACGAWHTTTKAPRNKEKA